MASSKNPIYEVVNWELFYENNRSRTVKMPNWVPIPNGHGGDGYASVMAHDDAAEIFAAWILILQIGSKCTVRGRLVNKDGVPYTARTLAVKTRSDPRWFEKAFEFLTTEDVFWLRKIEQPDTTPTAECAPESNNLLREEGRKEGKDKEEKGKTRKEEKEEKIPIKVGTTHDRLVLSFDELPDRFKPDRNKFWKYLVRNVREWEDALHPLGKVPNFDVTESIMELIAWPRKLSNEMYVLCRVVDHCAKEKVEQMTAQMINVEARAIAKEQEGKDQFYFPPRYSDLEVLE